MSDRIKIFDPIERIKIYEVGLPGAPGANGLIYETKATYAAINQSDLSKRLIEVTADENNNGDTSLYRHNGTTLKFLQTIA